VQQQVDEDELVLIEEQWLGVDLLNTGVLRLLSYWMSTYAAAWHPVVDFGSPKIALFFRDHPLFG